MLVSGEYVWHEYADNALDDWAAPAIQYCRALEFEVRRRLYHHAPSSFKLTRAGWTLGVLKHLYSHSTDTKGDAALCLSAYCLLESTGNIRVHYEVDKAVAFI